MEQSNVPHVVLLPFPAQGHIKPMLMLAKLISHAGFQITFINSNHNHNRLERSTNLATFYSHFPNFHFRTVPDGTPIRHKLSGDAILDLFTSTRDVTKPAFYQLLVELKQQNGNFNPPLCIIADGVVSFALDVAEELEVPIIIVRTCNASCLWINFHISKLIEEGQVPFYGDLDMDKAVTCIPGLEDVLRRRDLPSLCRCKEANDPVLQFFNKETAALPRASGLILNTFDELEAPMISKLGSFFDKIYTIGPLHGLLETLIPESSILASSGGILWKEDRSCMAWLDSQAVNSVIYVSFGSLVGLFREQLLEFWYGLVNSGKPFLWVIRQDSIIGENGVGEIPLELEVATKERGCMVDWAPQEDVLAHSAIGGFLTHSGWNSTLESIYAGVPMICWPMFSDQQVNSRCVSEIWKIGFDMKDKCERLTVEKMVRDLMEDKREVIMKSTDETAKMAAQSVQKGGSSYCSLMKLIEDIKFLSLHQGPSNSNPS